MLDWAAAAIACGIAVSVIEGATVKAEHAVARSIAHTLTGQGLLLIANNHGNRCCKRSVFTVLELAAHFFTSTMGVALAPPKGRIECAFSAQNKLCNEADCKFYPVVPPAKAEPRLAVRGGRAWQLSPPANGENGRTHRGGGYVDVLKGSLPMPRSQAGASAARTITLRKRGRTRPFMQPVVTVTHDRLRALAERILTAAGALEPDARIVADHLVDANLSGHDSHGIGMLPQYLRAIHAGLVDPRAHAHLQDLGGAIIAADGRRGFGQVVAREGVAAGIERARSAGLSVVALRNASHVGRVGAYGEQVAADGLVSIHFVNVVGHPPVVAPFGGSDARFLTNPICVTVPSAKGKPAVVLDFATSIVAFGKVRVAMNRGEQLQQGVLIDSQGRPSTDPAVMYREPRGAILPFGLHKGYGLAFMCELLAGAMGGGGTISTVPFEKDRITNNMLSLIIDPHRLPGAALFEEEVAAAIDHVKASPPADPSFTVLVAGEPELAWRAKRRTEGVPVEYTTWEEIRASAESVGLDLEDG